MGAGSAQGAPAAPETGAPIGQTAAEQAAGVTPVNASYPPGQPERYIAPGFTYASADGRQGSDFTDAINQALGVLGHPVVLGAHSYLITNLTIPATQTLIGQGMHQTSLICRPGSTGTMFTDRGGRSGAAKVDISGIAFYGNHCAYSHGFRLGYNTVQFGTEGVLDRIWVRDLPGGFPGIDINGNVGEMGFLVSQSTGGLQILGTALMVNQLECVDCSGFAVGGTTAVCNFGDAQIGALEVEAPASGTVCVFLSGNTHISMLTLSFAPGFRASHLVEIGPRVTSWAVDNLKFYFKDPRPVISGGNFKAGGVFFGGNVTGGDKSGEGNYSSGLMTQQGQFGFRLQQLNAFTLRVENASGLRHLLGAALQHRIGAVGAPSQPSNVATSVHNARSSATTTPVGPDATTGFAAGAKISGTSPDTLILDTGLSGAWDAADSTFTAHVSRNTSGAAYTVNPYVATVNVDGESRARLHLTLLHATSGAGVPWTGALAADGALIEITVMGFLK
jgi:hypothetical protein